MEARLTMQEKDGNSAPSVRLIMDELDVLRIASTWKY